MTKFWTSLDLLLANHELIIDRKKGSVHPKYPKSVYPVDYGYLLGTVGGDGAGIDVWIGSSAGGSVDAIICSIDLAKRDAELKLLVGCSTSERELIVQFLNKGLMSAILINRDET